MKQLLNYCKSCTLEQIAGVKCSIAGLIRVVLPIKYGRKVIGVFNSESEEENYYNQEMVIQLTKVLMDFADKIIELGYVGNMTQNDLPYVHIIV